MGRWDLLAARQGLQGSSGSLAELLGVGSHSQIPVAEITQPAKEAEVFRTMQCLVLQSASIPQASNRQKIPDQPVLPFNATTMGPALLSHQWLQNLPFGLPASFVLPHPTFLICSQHSSTTVV